MITAALERPIHSLTVAFATKSFGKKGFTEEIGSMASKEN